jgi:N6-L-threonylcarbamoyladenine synthase
VRGAGDLAVARADLAHSFQAAVIDVLVEKTARAVEETGHPIAVLGGGVAGSRALARQMAHRLRGLARVAVARPRLNVDNAAMIARAGWFRLRRGERHDATLDADPGLPFPGLVRDSTPPSTRFSIT